MLKTFLFIFLFLIKFSTCVRRVTLDISSIDDSYFAVETTTIGNRFGKYIVPKGGVVTTEVYDGDKLIWQKERENELLGYVRLTPGTNGTMVISSRVPSVTKILQHYTYYQENWVKFKTYDSKKAKEERQKELREKRKLGQKKEFAEESFDVTDTDEPDESHEKQKPSAGAASKQDEDSDEEEDDIEFINEEDIFLDKEEDQSEKDKDDKPEEYDKQPDKDDQGSGKSKDTSTSQKVLRDIDVLTKFQELISGEKGAPDHKTKTKGPEDDDDGDSSFKTCHEYLMDYSVCDECGLQAPGQLCLVKSKSSSKFPEISDQKDETDKEETPKEGLNCLDLQKSINLGKDLGAVGGKFIDPGDSISEILAAMSVDDEEISSILVGGPESPKSKRPSKFEPPKNEEGYLGFSTYDDDLELVPVPEGEFGFMPMTESSEDEEIKLEEKMLLTKIQDDEKFQKEQEKKAKRTLGIKFIKKTVKRPGKFNKTIIHVYSIGDLKKGFVSSSRKNIEQKSKKHLQDSSGSISMASKESLSGIGASDQLSKIQHDDSKSGLRFHSESDLSFLLKETVPLDNFRQKSETDLQKEDTVPPGYGSAPSTLQRGPKKLRDRIALVTRSQSEISKDQHKKSKEKSASSHLLTHLVKQGLKKGIEEVQKQKAKKESTKLQKKLVKELKEKIQSTQSFRAEQESEDNKLTDSEELDKQDAVFVPETKDKDDKPDEDTQTEQKEESEKQQTEESEELIFSEEVKLTESSPSGQTEVQEPSPQESKEPLEPQPEDKKEIKEEKKEEKKEKEEIEEIKDKDKSSKEKDAPSNQYDKALYDLLGARPKKKRSFKIKLKKSLSKEKMKTPKIVVHDPDGKTTDPEVDIPEKKERKKKKDKKDKETKTGRDLVEEIANEEFIIKTGPKGTSSKDKKEGEDEEELTDLSVRCKPTKSDVRWDDEDDDEREARKREISEEYLKQTSSCCSIS